MGVFAEEGAADDQAPARDRPEKQRAKAGCRKMSCPFQGANSTDHAHDEGAVSAPHLEEP